ncbi:hypothetical protein JTB14_001094 [Gonioctena quinquepunctata]|nr:hypothetical protein JTB14_001094 [Gonioctena quinquepunctata]
MQNNPDSTPGIILYTYNLENSISKVETLADLGSDNLAIQLSIDLDRDVPEENEYKINYNKCKNFPESSYKTANQ